MHVNVNNQNCSEGVSGIYATFGKSTLVSRTYGTRRFRFDGSESYGKAFVIVQST